MVLLIILALCVLLVILVRIMPKDARGCAVILVGLVLAVGVGTLVLIF